MFKLLIQATKYAAASAIALAIDASVLLTLTHFAGWHYLWANTVSFLTGAIVAYLLSVRFVFNAHRLHSRQLEISAFVVIGVVGYGISQLVLFITVSKLGIDLIVAKAAAAGCTFVANFVLRRQLLFHTGSADVSRTAVIVGAGPAGLTAAYELLRSSDVRPLVFETGRAGRRHLQDHQLSRQPHGPGRPPLLLQVRLGHELVAVDAAGRRGPGRRHRRAPRCGSPTRARSATFTAATLADPHSR